MSKTAPKIKIDYERDNLLSEQGKKLMHSFYMLPSEKSPQEAFARAAESYCMGDYDFAQRIYDYASKLWFMFASPVLSNAPEDRKTWKSMPISCYLNYVPDNINGQMDAFLEMAALSVSGGGVGSHNGIRAISEKAPGPIPYMKTLDSGIGYYRQGATRRGSLAYYMDIDHPDIVEHIKFRIPTGGDVTRKADNRKNFHNAVNITHEFTDAVLNDENFDLKCPHSGEVRETIKARDLWEMILETRVLTGEPYLHFIDVANDNLPETQKKLGLKINGSNLCVAPETKILTENGYETICDLEDEEVSVWNGEEFSDVVVRKTGENQKLIKVVTDSGYDLDCTEYHKFYVVDSYHSAPREIEAKDLKPGMKLIKFDLPVVTKGEKTLDDAYINGFYSGDGCLTQEGQRVYLYHEKRELSHLFEGGSEWTVQEEYNRQYKHYENLKEKYFVPSSDYDVQSKLDWLAGFADADGCIYRNGTNEQLIMSSIEKEFLKEIQMMLQTLGVSSKIKLLSEEGMRMLPANDGSGELKEFFCNQSWRLLITSYDLFRLTQLGFKTNRLKFNTRMPQRDAKRFITVEEIVDTGRYDDTFCFTEHKRHMGMFNGILTGQCSEIELATSEERTAVCALSSVNAEKEDEWKDTNMIADLIRLIDNVIQIFVDNAPDTLSKAVYSASRERSIGLGVMGFHGYLMKNMIPFESGGFGSAVQANHKLFRMIKDQAVRSSQQLAIERGEAPDMEGTGMRNAHLLAIAPNSNSSAICNCTPSIEPIKNNAYVHTTRAGTFLVKNPYLDKYIKSLNLDEATEKALWKQIVDDDGSIQNVSDDIISQDAKKVFKTANEIDQHWLVQHGEDRAQYICQGQSLNLFFPSNSDRAYVNSVYLKAMRGKKLKALYYHRTENKQQADTVKDVSRQALQDWKDDGDESVCIACEG